MNAFIRALSSALVTAALASCSLLGASHKQAKTEAPPATVEPPVPPPVPTHHFVLEPGQDIVGLIQITTASKEDTLTDIARRFNVGYEEIVRANPGVDPWMPGEGREIVVPTQFILPHAPRDGVVINIPQMRIYYFPKRKAGERQVVVTHPIGIGKVGWRTPEGVTKVVRKKKDPTWRPTASIIREHRKNGEELERVVGPGPDNPLGRHAFYLGWPSYMIHGTNKPAGVGLRSSHGCLRLYPEDIARLFEMVPVGTPVRVVNEPFVFGWQDNELHLQAFHILEDDPRDWKKSKKKLLAKALSPAIRKELKQRGEELDWERITAATEEPRGLPITVSGEGGGIDHLLAAARKVQNRVPDGATWDGKSDLPMDEGSFKEMISDTESEPMPPAGAPSSPAEATRTGT